MKQLNRTVATLAGKRNSRIWPLILSLFAVVVATDQIQAGSVESARFLYQLGSAERAEELINIDTGKQRIHALYIANKGKQALGAVILLHDAYGQPNDAPLISGLRNYLPNHGWASLSLHTPFTAYETLPFTQNELVAEIKIRVDSAIKYLKEQGYKQFAIIGEGLGATLAANAAENVNQGPIFTVVCIDSVRHPQLSTENHPDNLLANLEIPALDLQIRTRPLGANYTENQNRRTAIKAGNPRYTWMHLPATHLQGRVTPIKLRVRGWLQRHSSQLTLVP